MATIKGIAHDERHRPLRAIAVAVAAAAVVAFSGAFWLLFAPGNSYEWQLPARKESVPDGSLLTSGPAGCPGRTRIDGTATSGNVFSGRKVRDFRLSSAAGLVRRRASRSSSSSCSLPPRLRHGECKSWAVTTTVNNVTQSVARTCDHLKDWCVAVVADLKTPKDYSYPNGACRMIYIDVDTQNEWARSCAFVAQLPWNHSSRKNIGYLAAIANGAEHVWDFDDDNELLGPYPVALTSSGSHMRRWSLPAGASDILNPYPLLGSSTFSWPRGFPLSRIKDDTTVPKRANVIEE